MEQQITTYNGFKDFGTKVSVMTSDGYFGFFKSKKDGTPTKALISFKNIAPEIGDRITITYEANEYNGKMYNNAVNFSKSYNAEPPKRDNSGDIIDKIAKLNENQEKLVKKILELEKKFEGLQAIISVEKGSDYVQLHSSTGDLTDADIAKMF